MKIYPDKDKAFPNPAIPSLCYIKNVVKNPRIIIGDYTYYDDVTEPTDLRNTLHISMSSSVIG